jgi:hypothetical protein
VDLDIPEEIEGDAACLHDPDLYVEADIPEELEVL